METNNFLGEFDMLDGWGLFEWLVIILLLGIFLVIRKINGDNAEFMVDEILSNHLRPILEGVEVCKLKVDRNDTSIRDLRELIKPADLEEKERHQNFINNID